MNEIFNHLWQSTAFAAAIALATLALRRNSPRVRYWLWLAASVKFLIPFSLLVSTGSRVPIPHGVPTFHAVTVQQMSFAFSPVVTPVRGPFPWIWVWAVGVLFFAVRWFRNWRFVKTERTLEPGVYGLFRPVLRLPEGLTDEQLSAVVAHEERHIECFDNLTAALHMVVETLFWFHPLVWWIGARMMEERERDCDEAVLRRGSHPGAYARSIVQVCQTYVESPLACASGISGSDLKKRIREIMTWRGSLPVTRTGKAMLAVAALAAVSLPFALGVLRAQTLPPAPTLTYGAVSIHKSPPGQAGHQIGPGPQGGWRVSNMSTLSLMEVAYNIENYQIIGAPGWVSSDCFDIVFTPDKAESAPTGRMDRNAQRLQDVLRDRFGLVLRTEKHELPIYNLIQAKSGHKLLPHDPGKRGSIGENEHQITVIGESVGTLAKMLSGLFGRPVHDETGLNGQYDFKLDWVPDSAPADGPSLFTALTDQLGLKLESAKGPVQVYLVEKIEQPTEN
jgi:uncharacterized protein (TIGR03435 family)